MRVLCLDCSQVADIDPDDLPENCPSCHSRGVPADLDDALTITIARHELRVLVVWAEFHAATIGKQGIVAGVAKRLREQDPKDRALTFSDELAELADAYPGMETNFPIHRDDTDPREGS